MMAEQKLINEIQNMFKRLEKDDEKERYLYFSPKYNPQVKITDWFLPQEAYPKDNDPYHPPGGDYFVSTYRRLGTDDVTELETTTQAMLRQICTPAPPPSPYRPMVNAATQDLIRIRNEDLIKCKGPSCTEHEFDTTYNYDYRNPFPYRRPLIYKTEEKPQKGFGLVSLFDKSKICDTKFLDDDFYQQQMRQWQSKTRDDTSMIQQERCCPRQVVTGNGTALSCRCMCKQFHLEH